MPWLHIGKRFLSKTYSVATYAIQYGCIAYCTLEFVGDFVVCSGPSMQPTINSSDIVITEHISTALRKIKRGDIVIARCPINPHQHICKRVAAIEGDKIKRGLRTEYVPKGHVWLEGDNKKNSTDSRTYGAVPVALLRGKVCFKVWPFWDVGGIK